MFISIYYIILSVIIIYIFHQFIVYLKNTFTIPKVLDVTNDFTGNLKNQNYKVNNDTNINNDSNVNNDTNVNNNDNNIHVNNTFNVDSGLSPLTNNTSLDNEPLNDDMDELSNYLHNITTL